MSLEKKIYDLVKSNKKLKNKLKFIYQLALLPVALCKKKIKTDYDIVAEIPGYFGFHDRPSLRNNNLLFHENIENDSVDICVYSLTEEKVIFRTMTNCFNNQQGSMLTWFDDESIIYNDFSNGNPVTKIRNILSAEVRIIEGHFFSLSDSRTKVTLINFKRFGVGLPGYGYNVNYSDEINTDSKIMKSKSNSSDLIVYDLLTGEYLKRFDIISLSNLASNLLTDGYYYFSHSKFSPDSSKLFFLLRTSDDKINKSQLFVYDFEAYTLKVIKTGGMVSHLSWLDNESIISYSNDENKRDGYYVYNVNSAIITLLDYDNLMNVDGHPSNISSHEFITDTYANKYRRQILYKANMEKKSIEIILDVFSPFKFSNEKRVDLHPRMSTCNHYITIDTSYSGKPVQLVLTKRK